jgi:hypothetical protein
MQVACTCKGKQTTAGCKKNLWRHGEHELEIDACKHNIMLWYGEGHMVKNNNCKCKNLKKCVCKTIGKQCTDDACKCIKPLESKARGRRVFELLQMCYQTVEWDGDDKPVRQDFKLVLDSEPVCLPVFQAGIGVSPGVIKRMMTRIRRRKTTAYDGDAKGEPGGKQDTGVKGGTKWESVVVWAIHYGLSCGDHSPERDAIILPHVELKYMHEEYKNDMGLMGRTATELASYSTFCDVWRNEPCLAKYEISNLKLNFQRCYVCTKIAAAINKCKTVKQRDHWRSRRTAHLNVCKCERLHYETCKQAAERGECTCIVIDGWSIWSCTCPYTTQTIKGLEGLPGLPLKVTGTIIHGKQELGEKLVSFYVSDPNISHDSNLNCEVVRLALNDYVARGGTIKSKLYIQADNAGAHSCQQKLVLVSGVGRCR